MQGVFVIDSGSRLEKSELDSKRDWSLLQMFLAIRRLVLMSEAVHDEVDAS